MAGAGFTQTGFHGGEWSKFAQGLMADEAYKIAMNVCLNGLPMEEGGWTRRPGFYHVANTRLGAQALVIPFIETEGQQYTIELTDSTIRVYLNDDILTDLDSQVVASISPATPAVMTLPSAATWATGDHVVFTIAQA